MATNRKKAKLLYLLEIFEQKTDEDCPLSINELIEELSKKGISAERKSLYDDIAVLCDIGYDIVSIRDKKVGYFLASRKFEYPEVKLFADAVLSAKFITTKKSKELLQKIESLLSNNQANKLKKQVFLANREKTQNEEIYYNIDKIAKAVEANKKISFKYFEYTAGKEKRFRKGGRSYEVSPYAMLWFEDAYYLVGNMQRFDNLVHFRVDRMANVEIKDELSRPVKEVSEFANYLDSAEYHKGLFSMFGGDQKTVRIKFSKNLSTAVFDKFGLNATVIEKDETSFTVSVMVRVSEGFLSWIMLFGKQSEILSPIEVRDSIKNLALDIQNIYK